MKKRMIRLLSASCLAASMLTACANTSVENMTGTVAPDVTIATDAPTTVQDITEAPTTAMETSEEVITTVAQVDVDAFVYTNNYGVTLNMLEDNFYLNSAEGTDKFYWNGITVTSTVDEVAERFTSLLGEPTEQGVNTDETHWNLLGTGASYYIWNGKNIAGLYVKLDYTDAGWCMSTSPNFNLS